MIVLPEKNEGEEEVDDEPDGGERGAPEEAVDPDEGDAVTEGGGAFGLDETSLLEGRGGAAGSCGGGTGWGTMPEGGEGGVGGGEGGFRCWALCCMLIMDAPLLSYS